MRGCFADNARLQAVINIVHIRQQTFTPHLTFYDKFFDIQIQIPYTPFNKKQLLKKGELVSLRILIGVLIYRKGAYILDKFLSNQAKIQQQSPSSELVIATAEHDFAGEIESMMNRWQLKGRILTYEIVKPEKAKNIIWNIASGREAVRQYFLYHSQAEGLLFLDADMIYEPKVVEIMSRELNGYDVVFSGYHRRDFGIGLAGAGCLLLNRDALEKIRVRCFEFGNGEIITEDTTLEMDLFRCGCHIKKGIFVSLAHYINLTESRHISPTKVSLFRKVSNNAFIRYCLIRASIMIHYNIPKHLRVLLNGIVKYTKKHRRYVKS